MILASDKIDKGAFILRAISHPVRMKIIQLLGNTSKMSVSDICSHLETEQSSTSHHLINMKLKGLLCSERSGKNIFYFLKDREILKIFDCLENCDCSLM